MQRTHKEFPTLLTHDVYHSEPPFHTYLVDKPPDEYISCPTTHIPTDKNEPGNRKN